MIFDQSAKQYVVFRLASRADVCEAQSRIRRCIVVLPSNSVADIRKLVRLSLDPALGLPCSIKHLRCYLSVALAGWPHLKHLLQHTAEAHLQFRLPRLQCRVADWSLHRLTWETSVFGLRYFGYGGVQFHV